MPLRLFLALVLAHVIPSAAGAQWEPASVATTAEFRGLSAAGDSVVWAGGRNGTIAWTLDAGRTWSVDTVPGAGGLFFIDVHAVDARTVYLLGTSFDGGLARIYRTDDGGRSWVRQYEDDRPGAFYDGFAFWGADRGVAFGDPVEGGFTIVRTEDGGRTWERVPADRIPAPLEGEAGFAASGTAIAAQPGGLAWIGTGGGRVARVLRSEDAGRSWVAVETPLAGGPTAGIFGVAFRDPLHGVAVGGDYQQRTEAAVNVLRTTDGGRSWTLAGASSPAGVRYGAAYAPAAGLLVAVGPSGSGYSRDDGATWTALGDVGYNTAAFGGVAPATAWAAGPEGRIARWGGGSTGADRLDRVR